MGKSFLLPDRRFQMIRNIMRDEAFLAQKAELATSDDLPVAQDLLDTLWTAQIIQHEVDHCEGIII